MLPSYACVCVCVCVYVSSTVVPTCICTLQGPPCPSPLCTSISRRRQRQQQHTRATTTHSDKFWFRPLSILKGHADMTLGGTELKAQILPGTGNVGRTGLSHGQLGKHLRRGRSSRFVGCRRRHDERTSDSTCHRQHCHDSKHCCCPCRLVVHHGHYDSLQYSLSSSRTLAGVGLRCVEASRGERRRMMNVCVCMCVTVCGQTEGRIPMADR